MSTRSSANATMAREHSREADGKFGQQRFARVVVDLDADDWVASPEVSRAESSIEAARQLDVHAYLSEQPDAVTWLDPDETKVHFLAHNTPGGEVQVRQAVIESGVTPQEADRLLQAVAAVDAKPGATYEEARTAIGDAGTSLYGSEAGVLSGAEERLARLRMRALCASVPTRDFDLLTEPLDGHRDTAELSARLDRIAKFQVAQRALDDTEDLLEGRVGPNPAAVYSGTLGERYDQQDASAVEIARKVRSDVKRLQGAGALPEGKVSVRSDRFAGGQAVRISAEVDADLLYLEGTDHYGARTDIVSTYSRNLDQRFQTLSDQYGYSDTDSMTDYWNVNHYTSVQLRPR